MGAVFGYSAPDVNLDVQNAHDHINAYQFAGYGSFTGVNWFADALVAYGRDEYALDRQGVIDVIHGATSADTFTAAAQAGYLVDVGSYPRRADRRPRLHPRRHSRLHRDRRQPADHDGRPAVGRRLDRRRRVRVAVSILWGGNLYSPFVNVTAEQDFLGAGRTVTTTQVTAPLLPVLTPVPEQQPDLRPGRRRRRRESRRKCQRHGDRRDHLRARRRQRLFRQSRNQGGVLMMKARGYSR